MFVHRDKTPRNELLVNQEHLRQSGDSKVHWSCDSTSEFRSGTASGPSFLHLEVLDSHLDNAQIDGLKSNRPRKAEKSTKRVKFDESSFQTNMVRICTNTVYFDLWPSTFVPTHTALLRIDISQNQNARFVSHSKSSYLSFYVVKMNSTISKTLNFMRILECGRLQKHRLRGYQRKSLCQWAPLSMSVI